MERTDKVFPDDRQRQKLPHSRIVKLVYRRKSGLPVRDPETAQWAERDVLTVAAERNGTVTVERTGCRVGRPFCETRRLSGGATRRLFRQMKRCVTNKKSVRTAIYDTTGRSFTLYFADGAQYRFDDVYGRPGRFTVDHMRRFLERCRRSGKFGEIPDDLRV